jgi:hypothetical protein
MTRFFVGTLTLVVLYSLLDFTVKHGDELQGIPRTVGAFLDRLTDPRLPFIDYPPGHPKRVRVVKGGGGSFRGHGASGSW